MKRIKISINSNFIVDNFFSNLYSIVLPKATNCLSVLSSVTILLFLFSCGNNLSGKTDHTAWADSMGGSFRTMSTIKPEQSIHYIDSVYNAKTDLGIGDYWRKYSAKADYYSIIDFHKTQLLVDSMKAVLKGRELTYKFEFAHTLLVQGNLYINEKKYQQAFQCYYDGFDFARQSADSCSMSDFSQCLGNIYYNQGAYSKAITLSKESYLQCRGCVINNHNAFRYRFELPQQVLNTIAVCFEKANKTDSAEFYYLNALDYINKQYHRFPQKIYMSVARGVIEGNLGGTYAKMKRYTAAIKYMKQSIQNNDREGYAIEDAQLTKAKLAALYISLNHLKEADSLISQLHHDLVTGRGESLAHDMVKGKWLYLKWIYYDKSTNLSEAYRYLQLYKAYTDSLNQDKTNLKNTDLDNAFKLQDQQFQLTILKKNNQLKTAYLIVVILFLVLAVIVALVIWYSLKRSRENILAITRLNSQMNNTLHALETSHAENSRMMAIVAHDLRNPIGAMTTAATIIMEDEKLLSTESYHLLELIKTSGNNSLGLVNELLSANFRTDKIEKTPEDLMELLHYCVELLRYKAVAKQQRILLYGSSVSVNLNREKMWRVISNLIANAIKFSPEYTVITIRLEQNSQKALIEVEDHGIGIPDELKDKIFEMHAEAKRKGTAGEESFGLGLTIAKQIIEEHGGKIWFESIVGVSTIFYVELPIFTGLTIQN